VARITRRDKEYQRKIAAERVEILFSLAEKTEDRELARRYVDLATRVARKHRVKLGKWKLRFCKNCKTLWDAETLRVRLISRPYPMIVYQCLVCGWERRIPLVREKKERRRTLRSSKHPS